MNDDRIKGLEEQLQVLKDTNRRLNRRVQRMEGPRISFEDKLRNYEDISRLHWSHEFDRVIKAHNEIKLIFKHLCKIYDYPQNGMSLHSVMDSNAEKRVKRFGIWANCFLGKYGGIKSFRVVDEVAKAVKELSLYRKFYGNPRFKTFKVFGFTISIFKEL